MKQLQFFVYTWRKIQFGRVWSKVLQIGLGLLQILNTNGTSLDLGRGDFSQIAVRRPAPTLSQALPPARGQPSSAVTRHNDILPFRAGRTSPRSFIVVPRRRVRFPEKPSTTTRMKARTRNQYPRSAPSKRDRLYRTCHIVAWQGNPPAFTLIHEAITSSRPSILAGRRTVKGMER